MVIRCSKSGDSPEISSSGTLGLIRPSEAGEEDADQKRARVDDAKKQRINRLKAEHESRLSAVKIAYNEHFTMDELMSKMTLERTRSN